MIVKRLIIPGTYSEAYLYFDFLWLIDDEGGVSAFDIESYVLSCLNGDGLAALSLFARNDQLPRIDGRVEAAALAPQVRRLLSGTDPITISERERDEHSFHFRREELLASALDIRMYSGRAFVSVPDGLVQFTATGRNDLEANAAPGSTGNVLGRRRKVFDEGRPLQVQCRYGAVLLACGAQGGWQSAGALSEDEDWTPKMQRYADHSFGAELFGWGLGNVSGDAELAIRATSIRERPSNAAQRRGDEAREGLELVSVDERPDADAEARFRRALSSVEEDGQPSGPDDAQDEGAPRTTVFLTTSKAFCQLPSQDVVQIALAKDQRLLRTSRAHVARHPAPEGRIVAMTTTAGRVVAETDDGACVLDHGKWVPICEEPALRIRGYPQSRWYKQLLTIILDNRVELVFVCHE